MRSTPQRRPGFTLAEMMVIIAIIALLAAVVLPVVTGQAGRAQVGRVAADLGSIRTGIEAFAVDVSRYPGDVEDLSAPIDGDDRDVFGNAYPVGLRARWAGPYIDKVMADGGTLETGFGALILDSLTVLNHGTSGIPYVTILIREFAESDFDRVDAVLDDGAGPTAGRLLWVAGDTVKYLALPIQ
jgi:type II secretion system protein G